jgi:hypothetical protein
MMENIKCYRKTWIYRNPHNGYYWCFSINGRLMADTLAGIKGMIRDVQNGRIAQ